MSINLLSESQLSAITADWHRETIISNIYQLYQIIDNINLMLKQENDIPDCMRCGVCCSGVFDVSFVEAQVIRAALDGDIPPGLFPHIPEPLLTSRLNLAKEQLSVTLSDNHFVCPFYNSHVGCLIYKVRTIICRVFETALPGFDFIDEVKDELTGVRIYESGILCPNLKKAKKYPSSFTVWDYSGLASVLEQIYPSMNKYEGRLLSFFKYPEKSLTLTGLPYKFRLSNFLKII